MTPPIVPRALVAAATSPVDYESVAGDLYEEYAQRVSSTGRACADRWYWAQAFRSIPSLLSYSRSRHSLAANVTTAAIVVGVLIAMLLFKEMLDDVVHSVYRHAAHWLFFLVDWMAAALFGAVLSAILRSQGLRLALIASLVLVGAFVSMIALGLSSPLQPPAWLLLLGAIPAMSLGAAAYQVVRRR